MSGKWVHVVAGKHKCQDCLTFVGQAWLYYATPTSSTHVLCDDCVKRALEEDER
jgi:hypothetical protein